MLLPQMLLLLKLPDLLPLLLLLLPLLPLLLGLLPLLLPSVLPLLMTLPRSRTPRLCRRRRRPRCRPCCCGAGHR